MRSKNAKLTVVAIVLLLGAPRAYADDANTSPDRSPFAQLPGFPAEATYSGYVGDDSDLRVPPDLAPPVSEASFGYDLPQARTATKSGKQGGYGLAVKDSGAAEPMIYGPWVGFEYMSTWLQGRYLPPLVTTSPPGAEGVLPGSRILFGGDDVDGGRQMAGKLSLGAWLGPAERVGVGGSYFLVQTETVPFADSSAGDRVLARPIYETSPLAESGVGPASYLLTGPTFLGQTQFTLAGNIQAATRTDVQGAEGYLRHLLYCAPGSRLDLIGGYQFSRVDDRLQINHATTYTPSFLLRSIDVEDVFDAENTFHGGELGLLGEFGKGPVRLSILAKVGLGNMNEVVTIAGRSTVAYGAGAPVNYNSGLLALPTNMGVYEQDKFGVIPELDAKLIFKLTRNLDLSIGYNFIYWNTLAMAGDQIDTTMGGQPTVNSSQWASQWFGGALDPAGGSYPKLEKIKDSDLWLQGLSVGLTLRR